MDEVGDCLASSLDGDRTPSSQILALRVGNLKEAGNPFKGVKDCRDYLNLGIRASMFMDPCRADGF